ncbi:MAG: hypothetical protein Phog2KO_10900 [Phototrophicaceae bacterium]
MRPPKKRLDTPIPAYIDNDCVMIIFLKHSSTLTETTIYNMINHESGLNRMTRAQACHFNF